MRMRARATIARSFSHFESSPHTMARHGLGALLLFLLASAAAAATANQVDTPTAAFVSALSASPPLIEHATLICEKGRVPPPNVGSSIFFDPPTDGTAPAGVTRKRLDEFLVALLPKWPQAVNLLACAVQRELIHAPSLPDGGARLMLAAAERKHMRLTAALLKQGASLRYVGPREHGGEGIGHAVLKSRVLALDISAKVMRAASSAASSATSVSGSDSGSLIAGSVTQFLTSIGGSIEKHIAALSASEAGRVKTAVAELVGIAQGHGQGGTNGSAMQVRASSAATVANGLSTLLLRLMLTSARSATSSTNKEAVSLDASGNAITATSGSSGEDSACSPASRATALQVTWSTSPAKALMVSSDRYGRTPLHIAALNGNGVAAALLVQSMYQSVLEEGRSSHGIGHPLSLDGCGNKLPAAADTHALTIAAERASVAVRQYLALTDSLGATALELACAHGFDDVVVSLQASAATYSQQQPPSDEAGASGAFPGRHPLCVLVLRRLVPTVTTSATGSSDSMRTGAGALLGGGAGALSADVTPVPEPWKGAKLHASPPSPEQVKSGGGWTATPQMMSRLPRSVVKAVRAARRRLVDRLWNEDGSLRLRLGYGEDLPPSVAAVLLASGNRKPGKRPSINAPVAMDAFTAHCDADVIDFTGAGSSSAEALNAILSGHGFLLRYLHPGRPVLLRGLGANWTVRTTSWTKDAFLQTAGDVRFTASRIPYAKNYRGADVSNPPTDGFTVTISEYVQAMFTCGGGGRVTAGADAEVDEALCERLGYRTSKQQASSSDVSSSSSSTAPKSNDDDDDVPLYVFDVPLKKQQQQGSSGSGDGDSSSSSSSTCPWSVQPTPTPPAGTCKLGCGKGLNTVMAAQWAHDPHSGGPILSMMDYQLHVLNAAVPVDAGSVAGIPKAAIRSAAAAAAKNATASAYGVTADSVGAVEGELPHLGHGHAGDEEVDPETYDAHMHDHAILTSPLPRPQFYVGPPGSGAPMHWHKDAYNYLAWGQKRWFLQPPSEAVYSTQPIATWVLKELPSYGATADDAHSPASSDGTSSSSSGGNSSSSGRPRLLECTQSSGDVMYVPAGWGHAVLNTDTSIGVAVEFPTPLSR